MDQPLQTRSIHRALDVLEYLADNGPAELHQLHKGTGLPKSTLRRLLATLTQRRFVRLGLSDGMYRSNIAAPSRPNADLTVRIGRLVEASRPHLTALTTQVRWPSDVHIYVRGRMQILESTHGLSPFAHEHPARPDAELNIFAAASGLAWLSTREDREVLALVETLRDDDFWSLARFGATPARLLADLAEIRRLGYARRRVSQTGDAKQRGLRNAIAAPIHEGQSAIGAITISWRQELMTPEDFAAQHLDTLRQTAEAISRALDAARPAVQLSEPTHSMGAGSPSAKIT